MFARTDRARNQENRLPSKAKNDGRSCLVTPEDA
jgi:hypothetical protein